MEPSICNVPYETGCGLMSSLAERINCWVGCNLGMGILGIWAFFMIFLFIAWFGIYILTLIHQAKRKKWSWFVLTLIFNIVLIIYWITWLFKRKSWNKGR